jgi:hypothetical protein
VVAWNGCYVSDAHQVRGMKASPSHRRRLRWRRQIAACVFCAVWTFVMSYLLLFLINKVTPVLPTKEQVRAGAPRASVVCVEYEDTATEVGERRLACAWSMYTGGVCGERGSFFYVALQETKTW